MNKNDLRQKYKVLRQQLSSKEIEEKSIGIANQLLTLAIWDKTYFHIFLPIENQKEVDTEAILHLLSGKDKEVVISKSDFTTRNMTHYLLTDNTRIIVTQNGIPEPADGLEVPVEYLDIVFVPLLAFDLQGNRIGYGKGFYDKFLANCRKSTVKIGLSFFEAEESFAEIFESDVQLDYCVTPDHIYKF
ncbi:MAG TPA: 5-formyltetrahydrofolate cyclo-ligase [Flavobacterium sp.]|jgi:5-formyltetrahydrofolate cyclo-ligase